MQHLESAGSKHQVMSLLASALERDSSEDSKLGDKWLEEQLGSIVIAKSGQFIPDKSRRHNELGHMLCERMLPVASELICSSAPSCQEHRKLLGVNGRGLVDALLLSLTVGLGASTRTAAILAAIQFRRLPIPSLEELGKQISSHKS